MTPIYEVRTRHTKKMLEDFILFTYKVKYPRVTMNLLIMAGCFAAFAFLARKNTVAMCILIVIAAAIALFAFFRRKIGVSKLMKSDVNYQNQSEIELVFGEKEFNITNEDLGQNQRVKYAEISFMYVDDNYYYLSINNEDLQMIAKSDFVLGDAAKFYDFLMDKTGKPMQPTYVPWKVRIQMMKDYRDEMAEQRKRK